MKMVDLMVISWDLKGFIRIYDGIPSGNLLHSYGKWPSRNSEFSHEKW